MSPLRAVQDAVPDPASEALDSFREWRSAVDAAAVLRDAMKGRRVRFVGMFRNASSQPEGRIKDVTAAGFKIQWDDGPSSQWIDPDSVVFI